MNTLFDTIVFSGYTVKDMLIAAGILTAAITVLKWLSGILSRNKDNKYTESVECYNCHWRGKVSSLKGRCPKCNEPLGSQRARK